MNEGTVVSEVVEKFNVSFTISISDFLTGSKNKQPITINPDGLAVFAVCGMLLTTLAFDLARRAKKLVIVCSVRDVNAKQRRGLAPA